MREPVELNFNGMSYAVFKHEQKKIRPDNLKTITEYDLQNKREGLTETTRYNNIQFMLKVAKHFQKPFKTITRAELTKYVDELKKDTGEPVKDTTKGQYVIQLKKFFKWLYDEDEPDVVKSLVIPKIKKKSLKYSEMWDEGEVQKLIDAYPDPQRKAMVATLYDSGCRIGELVALKRKDVVCNNGLWSISVNGKTGIRTVPLTLSMRYLAPWFNEYHPSKNPESPLFISMSPRTMYKPIEERHFNITSVWFILQQGQRASGVKKKLFPHLLRHSRASWLSDRGMNESTMRYLFGWEEGSATPSEYVHVNPNNLAQKLNQLQGLEQLKPEPSKLVGVKCPRCDTENDTTSPYCRRCWLPLQVKVAVKETMILEFLRSELYKDEKKIAEETGEYLDLEMLATKLNQLVRDQHKAGRMQVKFIPQ